MKFAEFHFHEGGCMRWQQALIALWDVINAEGSLAVTQGIVVAVYGLDLVVTGPAIYVIHTVGVARVDKVVTVAGVHLVVAFAGEDLVVTAATPEVVVAAAALEAVLPVATREVVGPGGPQKRIVAGGAGEDLRQGLVPGEER